MSRSRAKGTAWESCVVDFLQRSGATHAERRALNGAKDRGDIAGVQGVVIEAKSCARIELGEWLKEANTEALNDGADLDVVWIKRRGKATADHGYVVMDGASFALLLRSGGYIPETPGTVPGEPTHRTELVGSRRPEDRGGADRTAQADGSSPVSRDVS